MAWADSKGKTTKVIMNVKKIIAREGLITLGLLIIGTLLWYCGNQIHENSESYRWPYWENVRNKVYNKATMDGRDFNSYSRAEVLAITGLASETLDRLVQDFSRGENDRNTGDNLMGIGKFILFGCYPLYLLVRFIIWAIRTLKAK